MRPLLFHHKHRCKARGIVESLRKNEDFRTCYRDGRSYANRYLVVYVRENGLGTNRVGISVSKKVGNSVVRHRIKRLVHESYRLHEGEFDSGSDIAVVGRRSADGASYKEIERALLFLLKKAGICCCDGGSDHDEKCHAGSNSVLQEISVSS